MNIQPSLTIIRNVLKEREVLISFTVLALMTIQWDALPYIMIL